MAALEQTAKDAPRDQQVLRQQLLAVQRDTELSGAEKAARCAELMKAFHRLPSGEESEEEERGAGAEQGTSTLSSAAAPPCPHYERGCVIVPACCGRPYVCRLCHDEHETKHKIDRYATQRIICRSCDTIQGVSNNCIQCGTCFGEYYCGICRMWKADDAAGTYHCEECGLCRVGRREDYEHCVNCNMCLPKGSHSNCRKGKFMDPCCVCQEDIFSSRVPAQTMRCGHAIHSTCLTELYEHGIPSCPLCKKSIQDFTEQWEIIQAEIDLQPMPPDMVRDVTVACNDCLAESIGKYHFLGTRCQQCGSFNTAITKNSVPGAAAAAAADEDEDRDRDGEEPAVVADAEHDRGEEEAEMQLDEGEGGGSQLM